MAGTVGYTEFRFDLTSLIVYQERENMQIGLSKALSVMWGVTRVTGVAQIKCCSSSEEQDHTPSGRDGSARSMKAALT